jgi:carboxyl-terminal processing protease
LAVLCSCAWGLAQAQVLNPGFELAGRRFAVEHWYPTTPVTSFVRDGSRHHGGEYSVRLEKVRREGASGEAASFAGIAQSVDAKPWRGKTIVVSAYLKSEGVKGAVNGVWARTDREGRNALAFASSYARPLVGSNDWTPRRAILDVAPDADRIVFGAVIGSPGTLWADDFAIHALDDAEGEPLEAGAAAYLHEVLAKIRDRAYYAGRVDWQAAERGAFVVASGARTSAETYDAVRFLLARLNDGHSFLLEPEAVHELKENTKRDFHVDAAILGNKAYLAVPGYRGVNRERGDAFRDAIAERIAEGRAEKVCGWIVDLRNDTGGNMYPMLEGLAALFGEGTLGYFVARDGSRTSWGMEHGRVRGGSSEKAWQRAPSSVAPAPIAILTGPSTASSGEAVTVSFRGLPNARSFGAATNGRSSGNEGIAFSDGAMIFLAVSLLADRNGDVFGGPIEPDEPVADPGGKTSLEEDPVVKAASQWIDSTGCAAPGR